IACRQDVGAQYNPALNFCSESLAPSLLVHFNQGITGNALTVANAVITRQVRACLCRGDDVIRRDGVVSIWHPNGYPAATELFEQSNSGLDLFPYWCFDAFGKVIVGNTDPQPLQGTTKGCSVIRHRYIRGSRIAGIATGNY